MWQPQGLFNQYVRRSPVLLCGEGAARGLFDHPAARIAVIHGRSFRDHEIFEQTFQKKEIRFFQRSWPDEPELAGLKGTIAQLERYRPDTIIAAGGGSVIDGVKLCRIFYELPYLEIGRTRLDGEPLRTNFIAVPTTVGSGAEVSSAAVYVDAQDGRKEMFVMHGLQPDVAVYDQRYVKGTGIRLLCASALDAMAHLLEGYVSNVGNAVIGMRAEEGMSLLCTELGKLLDGGSGAADAVDYMRLQYAGCLGGIVQDHCIVGAAHAVAHQLTGYGYPHGEAVALLLPAVIARNAEDDAVRAEYRKILHRAGFDSIGGVTAFIDRICVLSGIADRREELRQTLLGLEGDRVFLEHIRMDRGGRGNPLPLTDAYIRGLIRSI